MKATGYREYIAVTELTINKTTLYLIPNEKETLEIVVEPDHATHKNVTWRSSNEEVAIVSATGEVTGIAEGVAIITATAQDGNQSDDCKVTVYFDFFALYPSCRGDLLNVWDLNVLTIINNELDLKRNIRCVDGNYPFIDFTKHSLLYARIYIYNIISDVSKNLQQISSTDYALNVEVTALEKAIYPDYWYVTIITNKIGEESSVELNVTISYDDREHELLEMKKGMYVEIYPIMQNPMRIEIVDNEKIIFHYTNGYKYEQLYEINGYRIFDKDDTDDTGGYFRMINPRRFEIYSLRAWISTLIKPKSIFEKE